MEQENMEPGPELKLNMAMPYMMRIDKLLSLVSQYSIDENSRMMKLTLRALYRELSPYISKANRLNVEKHFRAIKYHEDLRWKFKLRSEDGGDYDEVLTQKQLAIRQNIHNNKASKLLDSMSIRLLRLVHSLGLLIPKQRDDSNER